MNARPLDHTGLCKKKEPNANSQLVKSPSMGKAGRSWVESKLTLMGSVSNELWFHFDRIFQVSYQPLKDKARQTQEFCGTRS